MLAYTLSLIKDEHVQDGLPLHIKTMGWQFPGNA